VEPVPAHEKWMKIYDTRRTAGQDPMRLVYWYGKYLNEPYCFMKISSVKSFDYGMVIGLDRLPISIVRK